MTLIYWFLIILMLSLVKLLSLLFNLFLHILAPWWRKQDSSRSPYNRWYQCSAPWISLPFSCTHAPGVPSFPIASTCIIIIFFFSESFPQSGRAQIWSMGIAWAITLFRKLSWTNDLWVWEYKYFCSPTIDSETPLCDWIKIIY